MRSMTFFAGAATLAATVAAGAQAANGAGMGQMDQMNMTKVYVGCLARTKDGHYTLTERVSRRHEVGQADENPPPPPPKDTMGKDANDAADARPDKRQGRSRQARRPPGNCVGRRCSADGKDGDVHCDVAHDGREQLREGPRR